MIRMNSDIKNRMIRMNSDKKNRIIRMNSNKKKRISISTTINRNYNVVITKPTFNFPFTLFTKIRNQKTVLCLRVKCVWSWLQNKQSQHTSFQKSMPKMWKACLLQLYFANRTRMPKAAERCPILQNCNFLMFLMLPRYAIVCSCCLFCFSYNQKLRILS